MGKKEDKLNLFKKNKQTNGISRVENTVSEI